LSVAVQYGFRDAPVEREIPLSPEERLRRG
jgi:hypothetical protein